MAIRTDFAPGEVLAAADLNDTFAAKANLASPTFTGTPAAPTAAAGTNTTQLATTQFANVAGGLVHINTTNFSAVSSVSINGCFTSTYQNYRIILSDVIASTGMNIDFRLRAAGTDTNTNYFAGMISNSQTGSGTYFENAGTKITATAVNSNTDTFIGFTMDVLNANSSTRQKPILLMATGSVGGLALFRYGTGALLDTTAQDGFSVICSTGTFSGTIRVYGYKNS